MEILEKIDDLITDNIKLDEFKFSHLKYVENNDIGIFYRESDTKIDIINYSYGYDYRDYDPITIAKEVYKSSIRFKKVEGILEIFIPNNYNFEKAYNAIDFFLINEPTLSNIYSPPAEVGTIYSNLYYNKELLINNIVRIAKECNSFIKQHHFSFFENFSTLQDINDKIIEKQEWSEWNKIFLENTYFKAIIIMKLCNNHNKYNEFTTMYKLRISDAIYKRERDDLIPYYEILIKLMDYLESGKYKELI